MAEPLRLTANEYLDLRGSRSCLVPAPHAHVEVDVALVQCERAQIVRYDKTSGLIVALGQAAAHLAQRRGSVPA